MKTEKVVFLASLFFLASGLVFGWYAGGKYRISSNGNVSDWSWYRCDASPEGHNLAWVGDHCRKVGQAGNGGTNRPAIDQNRGASRMESGSQGFSQTQSSQAERPAPTRGSRAITPTQKAEVQVIFVVGKHAKLKPVNLRPAIRSSGSQQ